MSVSMAKSRKATLFIHKYCFVSVKVFEFFLTMFCPKVLRPTTVGFFRILSGKHFVLKHLR